MSRFSLHLTQYAISAISYISSLKIFKVSALHEPNIKRQSCASLVVTVHNRNETHIQNFNIPNGQNNALQKPLRTHQDAITCETSVGYSGNSTPKGKWCTRYNYTPKLQIFNKQAIQKDKTANQYYQIKENTSSNKIMAVHTHIEDANQREHAQNNRETHQPIEASQIYS